MTSLTKIKTNEKQEKFLDNLISNGGNITKACVDAGYSPNTTNWLMRKLKDEIIERTKLHLSDLLHTTLCISRDYYPNQQHPITHTKD